MNNIYQSIKSIIRYYLIKDNDVLLTDDINELLTTSNKLCVSSFVSYVLNEKGIKGVDAPLLASFRNEKLQSSTKLEINKLFESNNIEFMYVKGTSLLKYYKDPYLRVGSDIDVVVKDSDYKKASKLLLDNGYKKEMTVDSECHLVSSSGILIDLHNSFIETSNILDSFLNTKFNNEHELSLEDLYLLLITHSVKHFKRGVMDLRIFIDLYFIKDKINDYSNIKDMLSKLGLIEYEKTMLRYLDLILGKEEYDDTLRLLEDYIIERTNDINENKNHIIGKVARDGLKDVSLSSYIISRIFIPKKRMYEEFSYLNKHKYLLPVYYIYRPFLMIYKSKFKFNKIKEELDIVSILNNNEELDNMINLYKKIGLYNHIDV